MSHRSTNRRTCPRFFRWRPRVLLRSPIWESPITPLPTWTRRDGARVPVTLIHRPDIALDGSNRTLLYAYGGFGVSLWPGYSERIAAWVRLSGIYAIAALRGGGEFGQPWHDSGRRDQKQNTF